MGNGRIFLKIVLQGPIIMIMGGHHIIVDGTSLAGLQVATAQNEDQITAGLVSIVASPGILLEIVFYPHLLAGLTRMLVGACPVLVLKQSVLSK